MDYEELRASLPEIAGEGADLHAVRLKNELALMLEAHLSGRFQVLRLVGEPPYGVTGYDVLLSTPFLAYTCFPRWLPGPEILWTIMGAGGREGCASANGERSNGKPDLASVEVQHLLPLRIALARSHPDRANPPVITALDHRVFHPAVLGPAICYAQQWDPTLFVADLLEQIGALVRFELPSDLDHPLNPQAAAWMASGHPGFDIPLR